MGVPAGTKLRSLGSITVTAPGSVINGLNVSGSISVNANNVTIQNTKVNCSCPGQFAVFQASNVSGLTIKNSEISGGNVGYFGRDGSIGETMSKVYMWNCDECVQYPSKVTDSYFYLGTPVNGAHYEAIYGNNQTIDVEHVTILNPHEQTATVFMNTNNGSDGPCQNHLTINNSLLAGGGVLFYPCAHGTSAGSSHTTITNNRFARCTTQPTTHYGGSWGGTLCAGIGSTTGNGDVVTKPDAHGYFPEGGAFGDVSDIYCSATTWTNNVWDDNGAPASC